MKYLHHLFAIALLTSAAVFGQTTSMALKDGSNVDPATWRTKLGVPQTSHSHAAGDITSGTIGTARLGSGTASSSTFLRGDQTWASISGGTWGSITGTLASQTDLNLALAGKLASDGTSATLKTANILGAPAGICDALVQDREWRGCRTNPVSARWTLETRWWHHLGNSCSAISDTGE
jgi:hypothetical protein